MNIEIAIIDQRLISICEEIRERAQNELRIVDESKLKSLSFVYLCVATLLDISSDEAFDALTEGGGDFGVDAIHVSEEYDGEFTVSLFQGKYKRDLKGDSNFPETGINALINAIRYIFDPSSTLENINFRLKIKVEEVRSLIRDGYIPKIRAIACNNGLLWSDAAQEAIDRTIEDFGDQVVWEHVNQEHLLKILQTSKSVNDSFKLSGEAIVESFNFSRVLVGRIAVSEIADLMERHGERLLERNIRRYLGLQVNRVNQDIRNTLMSDERSNFYFYNNGITLICDKFSHNAIQKKDYHVKIENLQIINGGQTCMTIAKTLRDSTCTDNAETAFVLVRLYELPSDNEDIVRRITFATNSQNPVDLRDLRANDDIQRRLEFDVQQLGYTYRRKRVDLPTKSTEITSSVVAEAILAVWRQRPHQAKFFSREHFGKLYDAIFTKDLNGAQAILATLIYRIAENKRRRPPEGSPSFLPYASCFIAMRMGKYLLDELQCEASGLSHQNFLIAKDFVETKCEEYFQKSLNDIDIAVKLLYGKKEISLQQLSATFRRGDLYINLEIIDLIRDSTGKESALDEIIERGITLDDLEKRIKHKSLKYWRVRSSGQRLR